MEKDLIFDIGCHQGEDTDFYLKKGFRVIAVEANPLLCQQIRSRFGNKLLCGDLALVESAISERAGKVKFYRCENSVWGTVMHSWAQRNETLGKRSSEITVEGVEFSQLLNRFGMPYYLKIDIEGADLLCLKGLFSETEKPQYVSIESEKVQWQKLLEEFDMLSALGYRKFKLVNQAIVQKQVPPSPPREGNFVNHKFVAGASGLFGEEAPGRWLTAKQAIAAYRKIFLRYRLFGDYGLIRSVPGLGSKICYRLGPGWYDTHCSL